jgi:ribose transport system substrate-binding protein
MSMNRREFLKRSSVGTAAALLAAQGINMAKAQDQQQTYYMVSFLAGISFWKDAYRGMQDAAEWLGVEAIYQGEEEYDVTGEVRVLEEVIGTEPDGIVVTVIQADALQPTIDSAIDSGLPVITFDSDSPLSKRYSFLGTGNYSAGVMAARYIGPLAAGGQAAVVTVPTQNNLAQRT